MSREEAATVYLDVLLGFRGNYDQYRQAAGALSDEDMSLLRNAVSGASGKNEMAEGAQFFGRLIENDNQYHKENREVMIKKMVCSGLIALIVTVMGEAAHAAQKTYVWTEEYATLARGSAEIEFWDTASTKDIQIRSASDWNQKIELEYGITDHLNASLYQVYEQAADSNSLTYVGYNFELKYRIAETNVLPVDVLLYAESEVSTIEGNVYEGKIILSKDIGRLNISYNQIYERVKNTGTGDNAYAAGISYELAPWLRFGVESKGSYTEGEYAAGPTLAWTGSRIWANIGAVFGLNRNTNDREARFILGVPF